MVTIESVVDEEILEYSNMDLENVITPVDVDRFQYLLQLAGYDEQKTNFLISGFRDGFSIGYEGDMCVQRTSPNLKLHIGNETILWNKVMKEVKENRYAGPFESPPFKYYIQSPIGLVPKDGGLKTRLIFHLSYPRTGKSVNSETPESYCKVKYCDFDQVVKRCLEEGSGCFISRSDFSAAFRNVGIKLEHWPLLIMKAWHPRSGKWWYFVDKCLPFGASISCAHFQAFSDAIAFVVKFFTKKRVTNYLDDFLFAALLRYLCNMQVCTFMKICNFIHFPVNLEKTFWGATRLTFLGLLIDTVKQIVCIPEEKINRAKEMIEMVLSKKKITIHQMQKLCGFLNFLYRAIVPGRAFTRRLYVYTSIRANGKLLKQHHHFKVNMEIRHNLGVWKSFLSTQEVFCWPFMDYTALDAEGNRVFQTHLKTLGGYCQNSWMCQQWPEFIRHEDPSISYLELYAVTAGVLNWIKRFKNKRIYLFCDNLGVVHMINNMSLSCHNCMTLIRIITLEGLKQNVRIFAKHIVTQKNEIADSLSRMQFERFRL